MATLATNVSFQCLGLDGKPLAGGKVYTYEAGTTTPKSTYTTMAGDVPNSNPVILDQNGKAKIFLGDGSYRLQIKDSNDTLIDDIDQISRYVTQSEFASFQQTVQDGVDQLTEVREQIYVFVNSAVGNQKGYANGIAPLNENIKIDPIYIENLNNELFNQTYFPSLIPILFAPTPYPKALPPTGFLLMNGQAITQEQYPILYSLYGANLPDMRGVFIRGWDNGRGLDSGRALLSYQLDALQNITGSLGGTRAGTLKGAFFVDNLETQSITGAGGTGFPSVGFDASKVARTSAETRPKNVAFNYIVKAG